MTIKPSDVILLEPCPLLDTFGRTEREIAAATLILALAELGDTWRPLHMSELGKVLDAKLDELSWLRNPFLVPDYGGLDGGGWTTLTKIGPGKLDYTTEFTPAGIAKLESSLWVMR